MAGRNEGHFVEMLGAARRLALEVRSGGQLRGTEAEIRATADRFLELMAAEYPAVLAHLEDHDPVRYG